MSNCSIKPLSSQIISNTGSYYHYNIILPLLDTVRPTKLMINHQDDSKKQKMVEVGQTDGPHETNTTLAVHYGSGPYTFLQ